MWLYPYRMTDCPNSRTSVSASDIKNESVGMEINGYQIQFVIVFRIHVSLTASPNHQLNR